MKKLILVADAGNAAFYEACGLHVMGLFKTVKAADFESAHRRQALHTGYRQKPAVPSHFYDPHSDPKDIDREHFAKHLVEVLVQENAEGIIIVAEPKMLHFIRSKLPKELGAKILKEIAKDLTAASMEEIEDQVFA